MPHDIIIRSVVLACLNHIGLPMIAMFHLLMNDTLHILTVRFKCCGTSVSPVLTYITAMINNHSHQPHTHALFLSHSLTHTQVLYFVRTFY